MSSMPWVKLYTEMLDDPKIGRLPDAIKWRFVSLVLLAGECDQDGALQASDKPMGIDDIAWRLRIPSEQCETEIEALLRCGVVELDADVYYLPKFSDRQGRPQSEKRAQWRERQARKRESLETVDNVTRDSRVSHAPRVDKSREDKNTEQTSADKPRKAEKPKAERASDELFDAIAKVTCTDPVTAGASIGKVKAALVKASPPYTASEVLKFGADWPAWKDKPPTLWQLKEQIGIVRNGNGNGHSEDDSAESIKGFKVYR